MLRTALLDNTAIRISSRRLLSSSSSCLEATATVGKKELVSNKPKKPRTRTKKEGEGVKATKNNPDRDLNVTKEVLPEHPLLLGSSISNSLLSPTPITLEEVEHFRPDLRTTRAMLRQKEVLYAEKYEQIARSLGKAFNKRQLAGALELYDIATPRSAASQSKEHATALILDKWGLKPVSELNRRTFSQELSMKPSEAFVILNEFARSGRKEGVAMSFSLDSSKLSLGARSQKVIDEFMAKLDVFRREGLARKTTSPLFPTNIPDSELQTISVASGAFLEKLPDSQYCITYSREHPTRCSYALLALNAASYEHSESRPQDTPLAFNFQDGPGSPCSLQPFSSTSSLFSDGRSPCNYRLSREDTKGVTSQALDKTLSSLRHSLFGSSSSSLSVNVMPGHLTFERRSADPLRILASFKTEGDEDSIRSALPTKRSFSQYIPEKVLSLPSKRSQTYRRLTYCGLRSPDLHSAQATPSLRLFVASHKDSNTFLEQQFPHLKHEVASEDQVAGPATLFYGLCDKGWKQDIDISAPDSATDLRLQVSHRSLHAIPKPLQAYVTELNASFQDDSPLVSSPTPNPPLTFRLDNELYILTASEIVRAGVKEVSPSQNIVTEVARDDASGESRSSCYVPSTLQNDDESWTKLVEHSSWLADWVSKPATSENDYGDSLVAWP